MAALLHLCLLATLTLLARSDTPGSRWCPGGYSHGSTFETGRYWYECRDGQRVPRGCLTDSGRRVDIEDTFDTDENRMQCVLGGDGYLAILYKSCVNQGREYMVNDRWDDGQVWYICKKESNAVRPVPIGCVIEGNPVSFDDRVAKDDKVYSCKKSQSGRVEAGISGCAMNGGKYRIGETAASSTLWYTCTDNGWKVIGCVHQGARLRDGDTFPEDDVVWKCAVNDDKTGPVPFACITHIDGTRQDKKFECTWTEGDLPYQYEYMCKYDPDRNTAVKVPLKCRFRSAQGFFNVSPGCYYKGNNIAVGCLKDGPNSLRTKTFPSDKIDSSLGLQEC